MSVEVPRIIGSTVEYKEFGDGSNKGYLLKTVYYSGRIPGGVKSSEGECAFSVTLFVRTRSDLHTVPNSNLVSKCSWCHANGSRDALPIPLNKDGYSDGICFPHKREVLAEQSR